MTHPAFSAVGPLAMQEYTGAFTYHDNQRNQSWNLSLVGGQAVTHDAKGNQRLLPGEMSSPVRALSWDFENKLIGGDTDNDGVNDVTYQ